MKCKGERRGRGRKETARERERERERGRESKQVDDGEIESAIEWTDVITQLEALVH